jgi:hypothetical protein
VVELFHLFVEYIVIEWSETTIKYKTVSVVSGLVNLSVCSGVSVSASTSASACLCASQQPLSLQLLLS